jgi:hypothetical protein
MRKMADVEVLIEEDAMEFDLGDRVRVWYASERQWKEATVRAVIMEPAPSMRVYYQVRCEGKDNPRYYRTEELQPTK